MRSPADPIRRARQRLAATAVLGLAAVVASGLWAFRPLTADALGVSPVSPVPSATPAGPERGPDSPERPDLRVYAAQLWAPAAPPTAASARVEQPPAARRGPPLQLVGITREDDVLKAAIYDPASDRLFIVGHGEVVGGQTITRITGDGVELADGRTTQALWLDEDGT